jgi:mannose-6-phosphate isomerase-like protein (cupin superfamily)
MKTVHITPSGQAKHFLVGYDVVTFKTTAQETPKNLHVMDITVPSGGGSPLFHRHQFSEVYLILKGVFEVTILDANQIPIAKKVKAGDTVEIDSLAWHSFRNVGRSAGKFTAVHSSNDIQNFVLELGKSIPDPRNPPMPASPPSPEEMQNRMRVTLKYMEIMPPEKVSSAP